LLTHAEIKEAGMLHPVISRTLLCASLSTLLFTAVPGAAGAADAATIQKSVTVRVADIDLSTPAGAATFYRRVRDAAYRVCDAGWSVDRECVKNAVAAAVSRVDQPLVTALHQRSAGSAVIRAGA
jgi:UrcA family protein